MLLIMHHRHSAEEAAAGMPWPAEHTLEAWPVAAAGQSAAGAEPQTPGPAQQPEASQSVAAGGRRTVVAASKLAASAGVESAVAAVEISTAVAAEALRCLPPQPPKDAS